MRAVAARLARALLGSVLLVLSVLVAAAAPARAIAIRVDWTATFPGLGGGVLSGSLGEFDVSAPGQIFPLPSDGSLSVSASGFSIPGAALPSGPIPFDNPFNNPQLRFDSLAPITASFVDDPGTVGNDLLVTSGLLCGVPVPSSETCQITVGSAFGGAFSAATLDVVPGSGIRHGSLVQFSFTVVPEPSAAGLLCAGAVALTAMHGTRRRRRRRSSAYCAGRSAALASSSRRMR